MATKKTNIRTFKNRQGNETETTREHSPSTGEKVDIVEKYLNANKSQANSNHAEEVASIFGSYIANDFNILLKMIEIPGNQLQLLALNQTDYQNKMKALSNAKSGNAGALKSYTEMKMRMDDLRNTIEIESYLGKYIKFGNLRKNALVSSYLESLTGLLGHSIIRTEGGYNLSICHNLNLIRGLTTNEFKDYYLPRYEAVLMVLTTGKYSTTEPDESVKIKGVSSFMDFAPKCWFTWVSPRHILKCKNAREGTEKEMGKLKKWVEKVERMAARSVGMNIEVEFSINRFEGKSPTEWWAAMTKVYQTINMKAKSLKGKGANNKIGVKWQDIQIEDYDDQLLLEMEKKLFSKKTMM